MDSVCFTCPECGTTEDPLLHTYHSSCGGEIYWRGGVAYCESCNTRIYEAQCDECGEVPDFDQSVS